MKEKKKVDIVTIFLIILLIIVSYCYAQLKIFHKEYINFCGFSIFQVVTGSMSETIEIKDIVILKITKNVDINDIVTYKNGNDFITHRIIKKEGNQIITKGDANDSEDKTITTDDIVGKVVFIISNVAVWENVLKTPQVIIALTITIIAIWFFVQKK